jgi:hypothetical protein
VNSPRKASFYAAEIFQSRERLVGDHDKMSMAEMGWGAASVPGRNGRAMLWGAAM